MSDMNINNDSSFQTLATDTVCPNSKALAPVYLNTRKEDLNYMGIGDPANPYDMTQIVSIIKVYCNDIRSPFINLCMEEISKTSTIPSPCGSGVIPVSVNLEQWRAAASGPYSPIAYAGAIGLVAGVQLFGGMDSVIYNCAPGTFPYNEKSFDINFTLANGDPTSTTKPGGSGYVVVQFAADDPINDPNGSGTYFFVVHPTMSIGLKK